MRLSEIQFESALPIEGYGADFFRIGGKVVPAPCVIHAEGASTWGGYEDTEAILNLKLQIDFILLGTGAQMQHPPQAFRDVLEQAGIGIDSMQSASACRTYNVLASEGRRVAAVLLPVGAL